MSLKELTKRNNYKWSVNEILTLQRQYELEELTIQEIALIHKRSVFSILNKLEKEQIIVNFNEARGFNNVNFWDDNHNYYDDEFEEDKDYDYDNEDENTEQRQNIDIVYFEDELMKKIENVTNSKKNYENKYLFDLICELTKHVESLEERLYTIETASNSNHFFTFIKNWFYSKRMC